MKEMRSFAFFDFDGTLIPGDSIAAFVPYARKRGLMPRREFLRAMLAAAGFVLGVKNAADSKNAALRFRMRLSPADREALDRDFVRDCLLPRVYPQGQVCLDLHRQAGRETVLVTASTENYMRIIAEALGFFALLATPLNPDGTVGKNCRGEEKPRRFRAEFPEAAVEAFYSDSMADAPMAALAEKAWLVRGDRLSPWPEK